VSNDALARERAVEFYITRLKEAVSEISGTNPRVTAAPLAEANLEHAYSAYADLTTVLQATLRLAPVAQNI